MHIVKTEQFEGPLDVLLQLIESERLDITTVSLARITEHYLSILTSLSEVLSEDELAEFLVVASKLLLIKSRSLVPDLTQEEEQEIGEFEHRLRLYQHFVRAGSLLAAQWNGHRDLFVRRSSLNEIRPQFSPPQKMAPGALHHAFSSLVSRLSREARLVRSTRISFDGRISVSEKIEHIRSLLAHRAQIVFRALFSQATNRSEIIASFLAVLELVKQRSVRVAQDRLFAEITIHNL